MPCVSAFALAEGFLMKRTPLKRSMRPMRAKKPLKRGTSQLKRTKLKAQNKARVAKKRAEYLKFMRSPQWKKIREWALFGADHRCQTYVLRTNGRTGEVEPVRCPETENLHVHHRTYARFGGDERPGDLLILCKKHHEEVEARDFPHRQRNRRNA